MLVVVPLSHFVSVMFRSRSGWLLLDLAGLLVVVLVGASAGKTLYDDFALWDLIYALLLLACLAVLAFWAASAAQVTVGRTDARRGHRAQSMLLWGTLLVAVVTFDLYAYWVVHAGPGDLVYPEAMPAPRGSWLLVGGTARNRGDFMPSFLLDAATGKYLRMGGAAPYRGSGVTF